jgi:propanol-preferring alcohol dehydrogenase
VNTAFHAITRRGEVKKHETVFLFGLGGLGFNALQIVRYIGARVIVSDIRQELLDEAKALGIPEKDIVPVGKPPQDFIKENGLEGKIDTVLDFVGTHQTFEDAQHIGKQIPLFEIRRAQTNLCFSTSWWQTSLHWQS